MAQHGRQPVQATVDQQQAEAWAHAGGDVVELYDGPTLWNAVARAVAAERERCAKVCEAIESQAWAAWKRAADPVEQGRSIGAGQCADSIAYTSGTSKQWLGGTVDGA